MSERGLQYFIHPVRYPSKKKDNTAYGSQNIRNEQHEQKERFKLVLLRFTKKEVNSTIGT